ncbi:hypothetical protein RSOLAG22IIIB_07570 [Rhizoctonia solani]|uniref:Uncharacterized protein n=1 Tax=Rhizoctonia solani TaxID=456999 RepID=A0A0K6FP66_9AGAM|nr:hypothetical protein RSOLAG22IIIB_07570 [Rhizoctonia solani]
MSGRGSPRWGSCGRRTGLLSAGVCRSPGEGVRWREVGRRVWLDECSSREPFREIGGPSEATEGRFGSEVRCLDLPRSSPRRHWPQKHTAAAAKIAASSGESRSRLSCKNSIISADTGGRGGLFDESGDRFLTPRRT